MVRRGLVTVFVAVALGGVLLLASGCGESKAVAQPSFSPAAQPQLLDIGDFSLLRGRPARTMLHVSESQPLSIFIIAKRPIASCKLSHVAAADGSLVAAQGMPLEGGAPHTNGGPDVTYWFGSPSLDAGYYRLDLSGSGRVMSLLVKQRHP
jgi:hypothetical protein